MAAKILLVEDDNNLREIYEARLQAEGYTIATAKDGEEALSVAKAQKPDLIISDVMMPRISGFEMLDILRNTEELKYTKVIMLTALGQADDKTRANSLGADRYLVKSQVTLEDIVKAAHELIDGPAGAPASVATAPAPAAATPAQVPAAQSAAPVVIPVAAAPMPDTTPPAAAAAPAATPMAMPAVPAPAPAVSQPTAMPQPAAPVMPAPAGPAPASTPPSASPAPSVPLPQPAAVSANPAVVPPPAMPVAPAAAPQPAITMPSTPVSPPAPTPIVASVPATSPAPAAAAPISSPATLSTATAAQEKADMGAQIESFINGQGSSTPAALSSPAAAPSTSANDDSVLANAMNDLAASTNTPAMPAAVTATPPFLNNAPSTAVPSPVQPAPPARSDGVLIANKKIIQPIKSDPRPDLNELLAREEARSAMETGIASAAPVAAQTMPPVATGDSYARLADVTPAAATFEPAPAPQATAPHGFDPNNIAL